MAHYFAPTGTGLGDGSSRANAQTASAANMDTAAASVGDGGTLYFDTGTYSFSASSAFQKAVNYESLDPLGAVFDLGTTSLSNLNFAITTNTSATVVKGISFINYRVQSQAPTGIPVVLDGIKSEWDTPINGDYGFIGTNSKALDIRNSILIANFSTDDPLFFGSGTNFSLTSSTLYIKASAVGSNGITVSASYLPSTMKNCIFMSDNSSAIAASLASSANNCCFYSFGSSNTSGGTNNIFQDPQFVDAPNGDLRLRPSSPCIGAATLS